jgi:6,7-dimethyl-8-ribityllumazine synthase
MNNQAPRVVVDFLQLTAKFNAYITPGSVRVGDTTKADAVANLQVKNTKTNKMTITHY